MTDLRHQRLKLLILAPHETVQCIARGLQYPAVELLKQQSAENGLRHPKWGDRGRWGVCVW
jgi:hypothetical protein